MTRPRDIYPGQTYFLTRRCTQRQFLLRPEPEVNNAFLYCLGEAAQRFGIQLILTLVEANHHHTVFYDPKGRAPLFIEHLHRTLARCLNAFRGRWENFWATDAVCYTRLLDTDTVVDKLVYTASNPVKDGLVERAHHWPGLNTLAALRSGRMLRARRPRFFFDPAGSMPETVDVTFHVPRQVGDARTIIAAVDRGVAAAELAARAHRAATGARILGRRAVLAQSWRAAPTSVAPRRTLRPRFAGGTAVRIAALQAYRAFLDAYRAARERWLTGPRAGVLFPVGTYALARLAPIATTPPPR